MDEFYEYTPTSRGNQQRDTVYMGMLRKEIFQTDLQRLSFIAGVYTRFGVANDSAYCIKLFNSISKAKVCEEILTDLKCSGVKYHTNKGYIPKSHFIYFYPKCWGNALSWVIYATKEQDRRCLPNANKKNSYPVDIPRNKHVHILCNFFK